MGLTYLIHKDLIYKTCWEFQKQHDGDFYEHLEDATEIFIDAYNTHDEEKSEFSTWLRSRIMWGLMDRKRVLARRNGLLPRISNKVLPHIEERPKWSLTGFLNELSEDAAIVVGLVLDPPKKVEKAIEKRGGKPQNYRTVIRETLIGIGWSADRILTTFHEIRRNLR